jgi:hypothetical protein
MQNLDFLCMQAAQEILAKESDFKSFENYATKGLGVLQEHGPYALILYYQKEKQGEIQNQLFALGCDEKLGLIESCENKFESRITALQTTAKNLDKYLLLKQLWEQTLIYLRYHTKALNVENKGK